MIPAPSGIDPKTQAWKSAVERVECGAEWLDTVFPGWETKIDLAVFNVRDPQVCVLGQAVTHKLFGANWFNGYEFVRRFATSAFGLSLMADIWLGEHGFNGDGYDGDAWVALLTDRSETMTAETREP